MSEQKYNPAAKASDKPSGSPDPTQPAMESAESVAERIVRDTCGMVGWEHQQAAVAAIITADRVARIAQWQAKVAELERGVRHLEETCDHHRKERRLLAETCEKHYSRIAELEAKLASRDAQWQARVDALKNADEARGAAIDHHVARIAELENVTVAKPRIDPALLETARVLLPAVLAGMEAAVARQEAGYTEGWREDAAREAIKLARALHAELVAKAACGLFAIVDSRLSEYRLVVKPPEEGD